MNEQLLLQLGVGGIFTVLVLRTVFEFLLKGKRSNGNTAGDRSVEFWQTQSSDNLKNQIATNILPLLERQTNILEELKIGNSRVNESMIRSAIQHEEILKNLEHLRVSNHEIRNSLNLLTANTGHRA